MTDFERFLAQVERNAPPDLWPGIQRRTPASSPPERPRRRWPAIAVAVVVTSLSVALVVRAFGSKGTAPTPITSSEPSPTEVEPSMHGADVICGEDGTTSTVTDTFTATDAGVPVTVWSPDNAHTLFVPLEGWLPFDNQMLGLELGKNHLVLTVPPGRVTFGCLRGVQGATLDPATAVTVTVDDPNGYFAPGKVDCAGAQPSRFTFNLLQAMLPDLFPGQIPSGPLPLEEAVGDYLPGVVATDVLQPALYPNDRRMEAIAVNRDGRRIALVTRARYNEDEGFPFPLSVVACPGSGIARAADAVFS
jgi:hypothetical protein